MSAYFFDPPLRKAIERLLLPEIQLPGQYIGGELGSVVKRATVDRGRFCFAFPDAYSIGMSSYTLQLLYAIFNAREDWSCERAFTPFPDMERKLRENDLPLYSLETFAPLWSFDAVGFTLQHEMGGTNLLTMLELGGIPIHRTERRADAPLILAGGPGAFNPEPFSDFIDAFIVGDGEESLPAICDFWFREKKKNGLPIFTSSERGRAVGDSGDFLTEHFEESRALRRRMLLTAARTFPWLYVPEFYRVEIQESGRSGRPRPTEEGVPEIIHPAIIKSLDDFPPPAFPIIPLVESVQDRIAVEIMRGCPQKCRFCQSSPIKRPLRFRSVSQTIAAADESCRRTGVDEVTLLSLSSSEYPMFDELMGEFSQKIAPRGIAVSVPSLRVNHQLSEIVDRLTTERSSSLTLAPEAATDSLRKRVAKKVTDEDLFTGCRSAFERGFSRIKLYFMVGFPGETDEDIDGIIALCDRIARLGKEIRGRWPTVVANVSNFVPKPQTPLQWAPMATEETFRAAHRRLREAPRVRAVDLKYHFLPGSLLEGLIARGDRRVGKVIETAWRHGARFDAWKDRFDPRIWEEAVAESQLDVMGLVHTPYAIADELPWDHITIWAGRKKLEKEYRLAMVPTEEG